jgi:hypothetical protein
MGDHGFFIGFKQIDGHDLIYSSVDNSHSLQDCDTSGLQLLQLFNSSGENFIEVLINTFCVITSTCPGCRTMGLTIPCVYSVTDIDHESSFSMNDHILLQSFDTPGIHKSG